MSDMNEFKSFFSYIYSIGYRKMYDYSENLLLFIFLISDTYKIRQFYSNKGSWNIPNQQENKILNRMNQWAWELWFS